MEYEIKLRVDKLQQRRVELERLHDGETLQRELRDLQAKMEAPDFWDRRTEAAQVAQRCNQVQQRLKNYTTVTGEIDGVLELAPLLDEGGDSSEFLALLTEVEVKVADYLLTLLLNGRFDSNNAIVTIHPGAGGTESQDWAAMLLRMYLRWAAVKGLKTEMLDEQPAEEAGIKSATVMVSGTNAFGYLKAEKGVHRLVRISPFDANARRHTSFAAVEVMPELDDDIEVEIDEKDLRVDTYRSSGAGGQHVNKTSSAVRLTHLPSGIVVACQNERSQYKNKTMAMKILKARLFERAEEQRAAERAQISGDKQAIAWGSQIRSYVFCPYTLVKDHRTEVETGNVQAVMDGNLDPFITGFLHWQAQQQQGSGL